MVVGEGQRRDEAGGFDRLHWPCGDVERAPRDIRREIQLHLSWRGNAREQQHMVVEDAVERSFFFSEEPVELIVGQTREIQLLVGEEIHGLRQHPVIDRLEIGRTLGDNHDVGTVLWRSGPNRSGGLKYA